MINGSGCFDERAIDRLRSIGGMRLVHELISIFLANAPQRIESARSGLSNGDIDVVHRSAHSLKSSAGNVGATAMAKIASELEQRSSKKDVAALNDLVQRLASAFEEVKPWLFARRDAATRRQCIAVVEDNADNRLLVRAMLSDSYDVTEYETGPDALTGIRLSVPSLVLLDVSLPGMDGVEVLARLRADDATRSIPVIALTAHAMAGDREKYIDAGFDGYVAKPIVDEHVLLRTIDGLLSDEPRNSARPSDPK